MIREKFGLIPRYNWDYKFSHYAKAFMSAFMRNSNNEQIWERMFGRKPLFTTSGRASLYAILKSLDLAEGAGVAVPLYCCPVVFDAIRQAKMTPIFVDINPDDYTMSASDLAGKIHSVSAAVVVHMFGHPADMEAISKVGENIAIIEDCAQSLLSKYKGRYTGFLSLVSFFSFRSGKYISAGEGSAIFSADSQLQESVRQLIQEFDDWTKLQQLLHCTGTYIKSSLYKRPWYGSIGYPLGRALDRKLNLTAKTGFCGKKIAGCDLRIINDRIKNMANNIERQRGNALYFLEKICLPEAFLPVERRDCRSNYYQFAVRFKDKAQRDLVAEHLLKHGIDTAKYLDDIVETARENYNYKGACPFTEDIAQRVLIIPNHYTLSQKDLDYIVACLNAASMFDSSCLTGEVNYCKERH